MYDILTHTRRLCGAVAHLGSTSLLLLTLRMPTLRLRPSLTKHCHHLGEVTQISFSCITTVVPLRSGACNVAAPPTHIITHAVISFEDSSSDNRKTSNENDGAVVASQFDKRVCLVSVSFARVYRRLFMRCTSEVEPRIRKYGSGIPKVRQFP